MSAVVHPCMHRIGEHRHFGHIDLAEKRSVHTPYEGETGALESYGGFIWVHTSTMTNTTDEDMAKAE